MECLLPVIFQRTEFLWLKHHKFLWLKHVQELILSQVIMPVGFESEPCIPAMKHIVHTVHSARTLIYWHFDTRSHRREKKTCFRCCEVQKLVEKDIERFWYFQHVINLNYLFFCWFDENCLRPFLALPCSWCFPQGKIKDSAYIIDPLEPLTPGWLDPKWNRLWVEIDADWRMVVCSSAEIVRIALARFCAQSRTDPQTGGFFWRLHEQTFHSHITSIIEQPRSLRKPWFICLKCCVAALIEDYIVTDVNCRDSQSVRLDIKIKRDMSCLTETFFTVAVCRALVRAHLPQQVIFQASLQWQRLTAGYGFEFAWCWQGKDVIPENPFWQPVRNMPAFKVFSFNPGLWNQTRVLRKDCLFGLGAFHATWHVSGLV